MAHVKYCLNNSNQDTSLWQNQMRQMPSGLKCYDRKWTRNWMNTEIEFLQEKKILILLATVQKLVTKFNLSKPGKKNLHDDYTVEWEERGNHMENKEWVASIKHPAGLCCSCHYTENVPSHGTISGIQAQKKHNCCILSSVNTLELNVMMSHVGHHRNTEKFI